MKRTPTAVLAATAALALANPAFAQSRQSRPAQPSPLAAQAMAGDPPDVPNLSVEQITLEADNLQVHLAPDGLPARSGLSVVNETVNTAGQTVRRLRARDGGLYEVVTDTANRILSSRKLG